MHDVAYILVPIIEVFQELSINYAIGGSLASSMYGEPRSTRDVDLVADIKLDHITPFITRIEEAFYIDIEMIIDAIVYDSSFNILHKESGYKIDIFLPHRKPFDLLAIERAQLLPLHGAEEHHMRFNSPEDVVLNKLVWYHEGGSQSERQWNDILGVLKIQHSRMDFTYLKHWAYELGVPHVLERAIKEYSKC